MDILDIMDFMDTGADMSRDMKSFSTVDLNKHVGDVTEAAIRAPVYITRRKKPKFVLMTVEDYERGGFEDSRRAFLAKDMPDDLQEIFMPAMDEFLKDQDE